MTAREANPLADRPSTAQFREELQRVERAQGRRLVAVGVLGALLAAVAVAAVAATMFFPVLHVYGTSMEPTLSEGDYVACVRTADLVRGDLVAFYYNNKVLVKRVIALPGEHVLITEDGATYVDGALLEEPYVRDRTLGDCDLEFPYEVPEGRYFVMGDHRATSTDSRNSHLGCVSHDSCVGRLVATVWPPERIGLVNRD